jgi:hypothetical protein
MQARQEYSPILPRWQCSQEIDGNTSILMPGMGTFALTIHVMAKQTASVDRIGVPEGVNIQ